MTTKRVGGKHPTVAIYDVAIPDAAEALEAVRRACGAGADTLVETIAELPSGTDLRDGESSSADCLRERSNTSS